MRKMEIESWEELIAQEFASLDLPDGDDGIDDLWPVEGGYVVGHNGHRWELDPASAEDYFERTHGLVAPPSERWRHFGH